MTPPELRQPAPRGTVSTIRGRWQRPVLTWTTRALLVAGLLGGVLAGTPRAVIGVATTGVVIAVPLLRVAWLVFRWTQEHDRRFVAAGVGLLGVVLLGGILAAIGAGG